MRPILERRPGCAPGDEACFGPDGPYWTFLGTEAQLLWVHMVGALVLTAFAGAGLGLAVRAGWLRWPWRRVALACAALLPVTFVLLAWAAPLTIQY